VVKYFEAFKKCEEEGRPPGEDLNLSKEDWFALLQHNRRTGLLDLSNPDLIEGEGTFARLVALRMVDAEGHLTPQGLQACDTFLAALADTAGVEDAAERKGPGGDGSPKSVQPVPMVRNTRQSEPKAVDAAAATPNEFQAPPVQPTAEISRPVETRDVPNVQTSTPPPQRGAPSVAAPQSEVASPPQPKGQASGVDTVDIDLVVLRQPYSPEAEQFKALRSTILFPGSGNPPRVILVTSTQPAEGKSFVAANLAASIALHLDRYVLLVDCDLRNPTLHRLFGRQEAPGLSEHLEEHLALHALLQKTQLPRLSLLSAGRKSYNPSELVTSEKMFAFLQEVKSRYEDRVIVMDAPPLMAAAESNVLAGFADGILLVVRENGPKREAVQEAVQKIDKRKILGIVGNFTSKRTSGYYYSSKKYGRY
jgi:exopolysaccharide/PEP-CTERM locus tyrosine autokinase